MNKLTTLAAISMFAVVGIGFSSALAAQMTVNEKDNGEDFIGPIEPVCGYDEEYMTMEWNSWIKIWNNGHGKIHDSVQYNIYNSTDHLVGTIPGHSFNESVMPGDLPYVQQWNIGGAGTCIDGTEIPEMEEEATCGFTIDENGEFHPHECTII